MGCASIEYGGFKYHRFGDQNLDDVVIKYKDGELEASIKKQSSDPEIAEILKALSEILKRLDVLETLQ